MASGKWRVLSGSGSGSGSAEAVKSRTQKCSCSWQQEMLVMAVREGQQEGRRTHRRKCQSRGTQLTGWSLVSLSVTSAASLNAPGLAKEQEQGAGGGHFSDWTLE